jgi:hypothetical protein
LNSLHVSKKFDKYRRPAYGANIKIGRFHRIRFICILIFFRAYIKASVIGIDGAKEKMAAASH